MEVGFLFAYGMARCGLAGWLAFLAYEMIERHGWAAAHGAGWLLFFAFCAIPGDLTYNTKKTETKK